MATSYTTLKSLTVKGLCAMVRNAPDWRDRVNAAEMLYARLGERKPNAMERAAVLEMLDACQTSAKAA